MTFEIYQPCWSAHIKSHMVMQNATRSASLSPPSKLTLFTDTVQCLWGQRKIQNGFIKPFNRKIPIIGKVCSPDTTDKVRVEGAHTEKKNVLLCQEILIIPWKRERKMLWTAAHLSNKKLHTQEMPEKGCQSRKFIHCKIMSIIKKNQNSNNKTLVRLSRKTGAFINECCYWIICSLVVW